MKSIILLIIFTVLAVAGESAPLTTPDTHENIIVFWEKYKVYIDYDINMGTARVATYENDALVVFYSAKAFSRPGTNVVSIIAEGQPVWGPGTEIWRADSFVVVQEAGTAIQYDENSLQTKAKIKAKASWNEMDKRRFKALAVGQPSKD